MSASLDDVEFDRQRAALWVVALALIAVLAYAAYRFVGTVVLGLFAYYATRPLYSRVHRRLRSRTLAATVSILVVTLPALVLFTWTAVLAVQELVKILESEAVAQFLADVGAYQAAAEFVANLDQFVADVAAGRADLGNVAIGGFAAGALNILGAMLAFLGGVGLHAFIVLVIAFYLLRDDHRLARWGHATFVGEGGVLERFFGAVDHNLESVYFGNILNALVTGSIGAVTYNLLNLVAPSAVQIPLPTLLGVLTGIGSLVPVVGMKVVWVPVAILLGAESALTAPETLWFPALFALVSVIVVDSIPDFVLRPFVSGRGLHIGAVMLAYIFGPLLWGWYGIFLGPLILVLVVEFGRIVFPWLIAPDRADAEPAPEPASENVPPEVRAEAEDGADLDEVGEESVADDGQGGRPAGRLGDDPESRDERPSSHDRPPRDDQRPGDDGLSGDDGLPGDDRRPGGD